jgi:hypothetical protein
MERMQFYEEDQILLETTICEEKKQTIHERSRYMKLIKIPENSYDATITKEEIIKIEKHKKIWNQIIKMKSQDNIISINKSFNIIALDEDYVIKEDTIHSIDKNNYCITYLTSVKLLEYFNKIKYIELQHFFLLLKVLNLIEIENIIPQKPKRNWKLINVYKCHIKTENNNFVNDDYNIDSYCFLKQSLKKYLNLTYLESNNNVSKTDIIVSSVYGLRTPDLCNATKIFYNGESKIRYAYYANPQRILKDFDYFIGFDVPVNTRMFRLPYWMTMFDFYNDKNSQDLNVIRCNNFSLKNSKAFKDCVMIATTDFNMLRTSFVSKCFQSNIHVDCPSIICKNMQSMDVGREGKNKQHFFQGKLNYLKDYKIEICFENTNEFGYVTEKIFGALMSGCIPIYWGSTFEGLIEDKIINSNRVIRLLDDLSNFDECISKISKLINDPKYYDEFASQPVFRENAHNIISDYLSQFDEWLSKSVLKKNQKNHDLLNWGLG